MLKVAKPDGGEAGVAGQQEGRPVGPLARPVEVVLGLETRGVVGGSAVAVGLVLGGIGALPDGGGWVWPLFFLAGAVAVGMLVGRRPLLVLGLVVVTGALLAAPASVVGYLGSLWMWVAAFVGAAVIVRGARWCVPAGPAVLWHLALLLPRGERDLWRAEVRSVLHACASDTEARRQVTGFLAATPATIVTSWRFRR